MQGVLKIDEYIPLGSQKKPRVTFNVKVNIDIKMGISFQMNIIELCLNPYIYQESGSC